jgi:single-strand DNA-binding protein
MSKDLNQCNFIGRLGKDIELRYAASGSAVANFSIACGDDYKDKTGAKVEQTNWVNIVMFGKLAEIANQYLHKGSKCYISGKLTTRKWQDQSGADRYTTEIVASEMIMLDSKSDSGQQQRPAQQQSYAGDPPSKEVSDDDFDEIPF